MPDLRVTLIETARTAAERGLFPGTTGNLSCRSEDGESFHVTPGGMNCASLTPEDIPLVSLAGTWDDKGRRPSSEWRLHRDLYAHFPEIGAILHSHSPYATALACLRREIPPFHYMIARFGGDSIRCSPYAPFGSQALSECAREALRNRSACLLANHGMVVHGHNLADALALGNELETLCQHYALACQIAEPAALSPAEMADALARFRDYAAGQP